MQEIKLSVIEKLNSNLCYYSDAYILVRGNITFIEPNVTQVAFKKYDLFIRCITKIDGRIPNDVEHLDLVMSMYNLLEYSSIPKMKQLILMLIL